MVAGILSEINYTILSGRIPLKISVGDIAIVFLASLYVCIARVRIYNMVRRNLVYFMVGILFIVLGLMPSLMGNDLWLISIKFCVKICLLFFLLAYIYQDSYLTNGVLVAVCSIITLINLIGIAEFFVPERMEAFFLLFSGPENLVRQKYSHIGSILINPNIFGAMNALIIVVMINLRYGGRRYINGYLNGITLIGCVCCVILSGSMNAALTLFLGIVISVWALAKESHAAFRRTIFWGVVFAILILGGIKVNSTFATIIGGDFPLATKIKYNQPITLRDNIPTVNLHQRDVIWKEGLRQFVEHPFLGIGAKQFSYQKRSILPNLHMHNIFGEVLVNQGLVGALLLGTLLVGWFRHARFAWQVGIILTTLLSHQLDCFVTHNILWVILVPWLIMITTRDVRGMVVPNNADIR